jgi:hypothetical protein
LPHVCFKSPLKWVHLSLELFRIHRILLLYDTKRRYLNFTVASDHHPGTLSDISTALGQTTRADRPRDHMDRDQRNPDQEQNPGHLDRNRRHTGKIQHKAYSRSEQL